VRAWSAVAAGVGVVLLSGSLHAQAPEAQACTPRVGEKLGMHFVAVCPEGFFVNTTPIPCSPEERTSAACEPVTALGVSLLAWPGKNRHLDVWVTDAQNAARACTERLGGRLPTPLERERARLSIALASLRVREEPGEFARLRVHAQQEWVAEGESITRYPSVATPPVEGGDVLLGCVAEPAQPQARWVPIGESCKERPVEGGVRSPDCAVGVPGTNARFELGCDPLHTVHSRARPEDAAIRCVVPERALRFR
jgi:hypothetical protein